VLPRRTGNGYGNHSCDLNSWWVGVYQLVTRRPLNVGNELTDDYATSTDSTGFRMPCARGRRNCPGTMTGNGRRRADLRERRLGRWVPVLLGRQRAASRPPSTGIVRPVR
jgi:hypothetical protein